MRYIRGFKFSDETVANPNTYPYNVLKNKTSELLVFDTVTVLYGENGSGKSTVLNILANLLKMPGAEAVKSFDHWQDYLNESLLIFDEDEGTMPMEMRYIKSEDVLYEIKKIQQEAILREGYTFDKRFLGMTKEEVEAHLQDHRRGGGYDQIQRQLFAQEKYSNGQTSMQIFEDYLQPDSLILLDEPEISLSPENQLKLAQMINETAYRLNTQFVIATHSPLMLGTLEGTIYNLSRDSLRVDRWQDLPIVKFYLDFFKGKGLL